MTSQKPFDQRNYGGPIEGIYSSMCFAWKPAGADEQHKGYLFSIDLDCDLTAVTTPSKGRVVLLQGQIPNAPTIMTPFPDGKYSYVDGVVTVEADLWTLQVAAKELPKDGKVEGHLTFEYEDFRESTTVQVAHYVNEEDE